MDTKNIYLSLDEARGELKRRFADEALKKKVREALGERFIPYFENGPVSLTPKQLASADNGVGYFCHAGNYIGGKVVIQEFTGDKFVSFNEEKKGLGRLRVTLTDGARATVDIMDFHENENKRISDCVLVTGEPLVGFHHALLKLDGYSDYLHDDTNWFQRFNSASDYYYHYLLHFVAHGVFFETFFDEGGSNEDAFTHEVVYPAIERIEGEFGLPPMLVRSFPEHQTDDEDFYWWSHSKVVNDYILDYATRHGLKLKRV